MFGLVHDGDGVDGVQSGGLPNSSVLLMESDPAFPHGCFVIDAVFRHRTGLATLLIDDCCAGLVLPSHATRYCGMRRGPGVSYLEGRNAAFSKRSHANSP